MLRLNSNRVHLGDCTMHMVKFILRFCLREFSEISLRGKLEIS